MLRPRKTKFRKAFKGTIQGQAQGQFAPQFGRWALKALEPGRLTAHQLEAVRRVLARTMQRQGRIWVRVFPHTPVSEKPNEIRMGKGKGAVSFFAAAVRPGQLLFEIEGISSTHAHKVLRKGSHKLPVRTRILSLRKVRLVNP